MDSDERGDAETELISLESTEDPNNHRNASQGQSTLKKYDRENGMEENEEEGLNSSLNISVYDDDNSSPSSLGTAAQRHSLKAYIQRLWRSFMKENWIFLALVGITVSFVTLGIDLAISALYFCTFICLILCRAVQNSNAPRDCPRVSKPKQNWWR
jgi:hypothetical protein